MPDMVNIPSHPFKSNDEALGALAEVVTWAKEVKARGIDSEIKEATAKVAAEIAEANSNIDNVTVASEPGDQYATMQFTLQVSNRLHLAQIMRALRRIAEVIRITRVKS